MKLKVGDRVRVQYSLGNSLEEQDTRVIEVKGAWVFVQWHFGEYVTKTGDELGWWFPIESIVKNYDAQTRSDPYSNDEEGRTLGPSGLEWL